MQLVRNRLLLLLVLLPLAAAALRAPAQAGTLLSAAGSPAITQIHKPTNSPMSGDPDAPQNGKATPNYSVWRDSRAPGFVLAEWMRWTGRFWMVRYLGVK